MPQGFLAVASQPSAHLSLEEFHAWYDEEHIPLRLNRLPSFLSGARYLTIDTNETTVENEETRPGWLAMYEIDDTQTFGDESYTGLRLQRSEREKSVMSRLAVLTRKTGAVLGKWGEGEGSGGASDAVNGRTTGLKVGNPSEWIISHGIKIIPPNDSKDMDTNIDQMAIKWAEEISQKLKIDLEGGGWVRTRLVKVLEKGKTKMGANIDLEKEENLNYFVVHEYIDQTTATSQKTMQLIKQSNGPTVTVEEWRVWRLHKAYPCIAQGNVQA